MTSTDLTKDLLEHLAAQERTLLHRHQVRLRVDKIMNEGRYALCSVHQTKRSLFRPWLSNVELASLAHRFLMKLNILGLQTLVSVVPKGPLSSFHALDRNDPFNLCTAQGSIRPDRSLWQEQTPAPILSLAKVR